jgi:hypothetical protein
MDMKNRIQLNTILTLAILFGAAISASAQSINLWRGDEIKADWSDPYKWKLKHIPAGDESVHFRSLNAVVAVSDTIELDNGMMLYGQDLFLQGNGIINLWSPVEHKSTVNIPASSSGHANLTLSDNLSLNGRLALAAKSFGTTASKGSVTLRDHSVVTGILSIGNNGSGSGQVFICDQSTYRIQGMDLKTLSEKGGAAELHILGGTVHIDTKVNPFNAFLADPSRKIIIGDDGKLKINSVWTVPMKKSVISKMINQKRIMAAQGCELTTPIFQQDMILIEAKTTGVPLSIETRLADAKQSTETKSQSTPAPVAPASIPEPVALASSPASTPKPQIKTEPSRLESLLTEMKVAESNMAVAILQSNDKFSTSKKEGSKNSSTPLAGYIVFFSAVFFFLRPAKHEGNDTAFTGEITDH